MAGETSLSETEAVLGKKNGLKTLEPLLGLQGHRACPLRCSSSLVTRAELGKERCEGIVPEVVITGCLEDTV